MSPSSLPLDPSPLSLLTDQVDERTMAKYEKEAKEKNRESWYLAYIMDTNEEERARGKTVEVGRAHFATAKKRYTLLDAPGHKNYVPNMIGGASQADVGVLVISARKGEFEAGFDRGGQTREHAMLAKTLGLQKLVVLVNKMVTASTEHTAQAALATACTHPKRRVLRAVLRAGREGGSVEAGALRPDTQHAGAFHQEVRFQHTHRSHTTTTTHCQLCTHDTTEGSAVKGQTFLSGFSLHRL